MEKHSPIPWSCKNFVGSNGWTILAPFTTDKSRDFAEYTLKKDTPIPLFIEPWSQFPSEDYQQMQQANAELIVKAVNNHEKLVGFLKDVHKLSKYKADHDTILYDFQEIHNKAKELLKHLESNPLKIN